MNFYQAQDQARKQSRLLVALFVVAVVFLVLITNICFAVFVLYSNPAYSLSGHVDPSLAANNLFEWFAQLAYALGWQKSLWVSSLVCGVIFIAMGFKWLSLRQGGRVVAEALGGTLVQTSSNSVQEKRLLNVVEEIALASGTPVPQVYLLKNELGINAFAAGLSSEDAVIGITQGALQHFNRDQLQGVIAHEFSHILNGDMRLNMKLVAVLHGILVIAESGRFFLRMGSTNRHFMNRRKSNNAGGVFLILGACLWLIGLLGQLFGSLIKAAVSRQREFLADASAVQFTRNADGIAEALSIIGGASHQSKLEHFAAHELGHLFFSNANTLEGKRVLFHPSKWQLFATHPPLAERIKRIQPKWSGRFLKQKIKLEDSDPFNSPDPSYPSFQEMQAKGLHESVSGLNNETLTLASEADCVAESDAQLSQSETIHGDAYQYVEFEAIKPLATPSVSMSDGSDAQYSEIITTEAVFAELTRLAHETYDASLMVIAILMSHRDTTQQQQAKLIEAAYPKNAQARYARISSLSEKLNKLDAKQILSLIDMLMPSLKMMSLKQYQSGKALLVRLIKADGQVDIFEWLIFQLIKQNLDRHFGLSRPLKAQYKNMASLASHFEIVLSRVVHYGFEGLPADEIDTQDKRLAFIRACDVAGLTRISLLNTEQCDGKDFSQAVHQLSLAYPLLKPRLIKSLLAAIHFDKNITDHERYVITAIAGVMDCPLVGLDIEHA